MNPACHCEALFDGFCHEFDYVMPPNQAPVRDNLRFARARGLRDGPTQPYSMELCVTERAKTNQDFFRASLAFSPS
jgi:hypothetical protein